MNELKQFQKNIKIRRKAQKRKRKLQSIKQYLHKLRPKRISKNKVEHIKRLKALK